MNTWGMEYNIYAAPALLTLILLVAETAFLAYALPETRGKTPKVDGMSNGSANGKANGKASRATNGLAKPPAKKATVSERLRLLKTLRHFHFLFLSIFSGVEFTLTFLTFDRE